MSEEERRKFLLEQLEWVKDRQRIYDEIDRKLREMRGIAEIAAREAVSDAEREVLQEQMNELRDEVEKLNAQLCQSVH
ncbi:hypothetical protein LGQ02_18035 [Bacillus shivajii]|uniref:hypothetical protein n=1 Tax=Bacillus shivajii TaxID=1983719 RepID=UPI001CFC4146|nr:hypothetical protein [Bacillus shivajii]UCZ52685.1 hypothetical protein LGQ02_18035 [Bacillus shivajii]